MFTRVIVIVYEKYITKYKIKNTVCYPPIF